jgi:hypothetical protein
VRPWTQLQRAVDLAGPDDTRPQFVTARAQLADLQAAAAETGSDP